MTKGKGASVNHGQSSNHGPLIPGQGKGDAGWDVRPERHWDWTEGRLPA